MAILKFFKMFAADSKAVPETDRPVHSWKQIIEPVEPFLDAVSHRLSREVESFDAELIPYAEYALTGQGKHLRPALVALTAEALGKPVEAGEFGADMAVDYINDGPVTLWLDSKNREY